MEVHFSQDEQAKLDSAAARIGMNPERLVTHVVAGYLLVESRLMGTQTQTENICPECGRQFGGKGFEGIDAHWRSAHENVMPYEDARPLILTGKYHATRTHSGPESTKDLVELFAPLRGLNLDFERSADLGRNFDL